MKRVVSVSLGSASRDHRASIELLGERFEIARVGTDGSLDRAIAMLRELDGTVDALGLGGIDVYLYAGAKRYALRDGLRLLETVKTTPVVDGSGLKNTLERAAVGFLQDDLGIDLRGRKVLMVSALDLDKPVRDLAEFEALAEKYLPDACKLPFQFFYPTGKKQDRPPQPKYPEYYAEASIVAGDFHFMRQFMPDRLDGKLVLTNTLTARDVEELRARGVARLVTTTPDFGGRSFGTNVVEAALLALLGKRWSDVTEDDYTRLIAAANLRPRVLELNPTAA